MTNLSNFLNKAKHAFLNSRQLRLGTCGIVLLLLIVIFAPWIAPENPYNFGPDILNGVGENGHIIGTNKMGQDIFSMLIYGTRTSLKVAIISALISGILGILIGGAAGFFGGKVDQVVSEIINIFMMLPTFFLILLIIALFGNSLPNVMIVIGITTWPSNAKLMRAQALSLRERTFVKAAAAMGETKGQILFKYIIPNGIFPVIANTTVGMSNAILTEASLSFLGLGDPNTISWGHMIYEGKPYITSAWWITTFAGLAIVITVTIFYLLGDGLNHALNPKHINQRGE
ncbi:ABC transporter permease [Clostridium sp. Cult3]|uniref:ABC transporter permease n=1 Tax=Clostridium sp. Cult3 TaxID=2079004 RepID=UPI001F1CB782|nr:ABC transporter permease [Clostridium sp. Cult3]MCF6460642.1 ABC transporter permease [Clostridium sp. Cult3]